MSDGISYHAKDILFKSLSELYKDEALDVFGVKNIPKIKQLYKEWIRMTKVGRLFEEEKQEAVKEKAIEIAKSLLDLLPTEVIAEKTGLDIKEVENLKNS